MRLARRRGYSPAQPVRSALFLTPVSVGTGKVFHPRLFEYRKSVFILPHTVVIQVMWRRDAMSARFHSETGIVQAKVQVQ